MTDPNLCVLTRVVDDSDPFWDTRITIIDTMEGLKARFDLSKDGPIRLATPEGQSGQTFYQTVDPRRKRDIRKIKSPGAPGSDATSCHN